MDNTWTVVKFKEENSVEAIPTTWLLGYTHCYWPPFTHDKIQLAIKRHDQPNTSWPLHRIDVFKSGTYDNYLQARTKAKKAENDSDLNSDCDKSKRKVRQRKNVSSSDSSPKSSVDELEVISWNKRLPQKEITTPPKLPSQLSVDLSQAKNQSDIPVLLEQSATSTYGYDRSHVHDEPACCCCQVHKSGEGLKNVIKQQILMKNIMTQILEEIQNLKVQKAPADKEITESIFATFNFFPINSEEHLVLVEEYLENERHFKTTVHEFSKLGGSNTYDFIKRCLNVTISNSFASLFSWHGAKKKRIFGKLKLAKMLLDASELSNLAENQKVTEEAIKKWLRRAKERSLNEK